MANKRNKQRVNLSFHADNITGEKWSNRVRTKERHYLWFHADNVTRKKKLMRKERGKERKNCPPALHVKKIEMEYNKTRNCPQIDGRLLSPSKRKSFFYRRALTCRKYAWNTKRSASIVPTIVSKTLELRQGDTRQGGTATKLSKLTP